MARIAEDLLLLLLDNHDGQPRLDRAALSRALAGALILDLAYDCRVRPSLPEDTIPAGRLIVLEGPTPIDPSVRPALEVLQQQPLTPQAAVAKIRKHAEDDVLDQLLRTGQIHQISLTEHKFRRNHYRWPVKNRARAAVIRSEVLGALFERRRPQPATATVIALLHAVGGFAAVLELNEAGIEEVGLRAAEIGYGDWADKSDTADVNLELTTAALLPALS